MKKDVGKFLHQKAVRIWLGGFKDVLVMSFVWVAVINFALVSAIAYNTTIRPSLPDSLSWISIWVFMAFMVLIFAIIMFVEWKFIYPSYYAFRNKQEYEHQNLLRADLQEIKDRLEEIEKELNIR